MKELESKLRVLLIILKMLVISDRISDEDLIPRFMTLIKNYCEENDFKNPELTNKILLDLTLSIYFIQSNEPKNLLRALLINELDNIIYRYKINN